MGDLHPVAVDEAQRCRLAAGQFQRAVDARVAKMPVTCNPPARPRRDPENVQRIVVAERSFHLRDHEEADRSGDQADENGGERLDETAPCVTVARPATAPEIAPRALGLPLRAIFGQHPGDGAGRGCEVGGHEALVASEEAASALPALKPNQPTHSRQAR